MSSFLLLFFAVFLASIGQILLKKGMMIVGTHSGESTQLVRYFLKAFSNPYVFFGFCFFVVSSFVWIMVLSRLPLSLAYPCVALGYVIVAVASKLVFNEYISLVRWAGIAVICFGVFLISRTG